MTNNSEQDRCTTPTAERPSQDELFNQVSQRDFQIREEARRRAQESHVVPRQVTLLSFAEFLETLSDNKQDSRNKLKRCRIYNADVNDPPFKKNNHDKDRGGSGMAITVGSDRLVRGGR